MGRELGLMTPDLFIKVQVSKRLLSLRLSETRTLAPSSTRSIANCLDVEAGEGRYLLTAQSDGSVRIVDAQPAVNPNTGCAELPIVAEKKRGEDGAHKFR